VYFKVTTTCQIILAVLENGRKIKADTLFDVFALMQCNGIQVSAQEINECIISNYLA
jgi:hypothetical protein